VDRTLLFDIKYIGAHKGAELAEISLRQRLTEASHGAGLMD